MKTAARNVPRKGDASKPFSGKGKTAGGAALTEDWRKLSSTQLVYPALRSSATSGVKRGQGAGSNKSLAFVFKVLMTAGESLHQ